MTKRVLVTGYGGFLGSAVVRMLREHGFSVRGIARGHYPHLESLGIEVVRASIVDRRAVLEATRDCVAIIHTAALAGVWGPWQDYYQTNTLSPPRTCSKLLSLLRCKRLFTAAALALPSTPSRNQVSTKALRTQRVGSASIRTRKRSPKRL